MPISQSDLDQHKRRHVISDTQPPPPPPGNLRRLSEESLPVELCEGPLSDSPTKQTPPPPLSDAPTGRHWDGHSSDRTDLIERLKRAQNPTRLKVENSSSSSKFNNETFKTSDFCHRNYKQLRSRKKVQLIYSTTATTDANFINRMTTHRTGHICLKAYALEKSGLASSHL